MDPPDGGGHHLCGHPGLGAAYPVPPSPQQAGERGGLPGGGGRARVWGRVGSRKGKVRKEGALMPMKQLHQPPLCPLPRSLLANDFLNFQQPLCTGVLICSFIQQNIQQIESSCYVSGTFQVLGLVQ